MVKVNSCNVHSEENSDIKVEVEIPDTVHSEENSDIKIEVEIPDTTQRSNYFIPVTINNFCKAQAMVDDGSTPAWVINVDFLEKLGLDVEKLNKYGGTCSVANKSNLHILGVTSKLTFQISNSKTKIVSKALVARDLDVDIVMGLGVLDTLNMSTTHGSNPNLSWQGQAFPMFNEDNIPKIFSVRLAEELTIQAQSEVDCAPAKIDHWQLSGTKNQKLFQGVLEPARPFMEEVGVVVAKTAHSVDSNGTIGVKMANLFEEDKIIPAGTYIGDFCPAVNEFAKAGSLVHRTYRILEQNPAEIETVQTIKQKPEGVNGPYEENTNKSRNIPSNNIAQILKDLQINENQDLDEEQRKEVTALVTEFQDVFAIDDETVGRCDLLEHVINLKPGATPHAESPIRFSPKILDDQRKWVEEKIDQGVLRESVSPWGAKIIPVLKGDGISIRWVVDYRFLNNATEKVVTRLPRVESTTDRLAKAKWFCGVDLVNGYLACPVKESDRHLTAINTEFGLYEFCYLPQGLCNAGATFSRLMEAVLRGMTPERCLIYLDDVLSFGEDFQSMMSNLREILNRFRRNGLILKARKCSLFRRQVTFLGHVITAGKGSSPDPKLVESIRTWPLPKTKRQMRTFLGKTGFYRRYIKSYAEIARVLYDLTKADTKFAMQREHILAWQELKDILCTYPVLRFPMWEEKFILNYDTSNTATAVTVTQKFHDGEHPIAHTSRGLSKAERNYQAHKKELLGFVYWTNYHKVYTWGRPFHARVDNRVVQHWRSMKTPPSQIIARWLELLSDFNFTIEHRAARLHIDVDSLTRLGQEEEINNADTDLEWNPKPAGVSRVQKIIKPTPVQMPFEALSSDESAEEASRGNLSLETLHAIRGMFPETGKTRKDIEDMRNFKMPLPIDPHTISNEQCSDDVLARVYLWLKAGKAPTHQQLDGVSREVRNLASQFELLYLKDDCIFKKYIEDDDTIIEQLLIPYSMRESVLYLCHDHPSAGHLGVDRTIDRVKKRFYWHGYKKDVELLIQSCEPCEKKRTGPTKSHANISPNNVGYNFQRLGIDLVGPLPKTSCGNTYILTASCRFSGWHEAWGVSDITAKGLAEVFTNEFVCRYGAVSNLHADNGKNISRGLWKEFCNILGIEDSNTVPYTPRENWDERFHRFLHEIERAYNPKKNGLEWDEMLPKILMATRSSKHSRTGLSPYYMLHGTEMRLPVDIMFSRSPEECSKYEYVKDLRFKLQEAHQRVRNLSGQENERQAEVFGKKVKELKFSVGDTVWYWLPVVEKGNTRKFQPMWTGPYIIQKKIAGAIVRIKHLYENKKKIAHIDKLSHCHSHRPTKDQLRELDIEWPKENITEHCPSHPEATLCLMHKDCILKADKVFHQSQGHAADKVSQMKNQVIKTEEKMGKAVLFNEKIHFKLFDDDGLKEDDWEWSLDIPLPKPRRIIGREKFFKKQEENSIFNSKPSLKEAVVSPSNVLGKNIHKLGSKEMCPDQENVPHKKSSTSSNEPVISREPQIKSKIQQE